MGLAGKVSVAEYSDVYVPYLAQILPDNEFLPGAMELVRHLAAHNIPMAVCSGSNTMEFKLKTEKHKELLDLIPLRVSLTVFYYANKSFWLWDASFAF